MGDRGRGSVHEVSHRLLVGEPESVERDRALVVQVEAVELLAVELDAAKEVEREVELLAVGAHQHDDADAVLEHEGDLLLDGEHTVRDAQACTSQGVLCEREGREPDLGETASVAPAGRHRHAVDEQVLDGDRLSGTLERRDRRAIGRRDGHALGEPGCRHDGLEISALQEQRPHKLVDRHGRTRPHGEGLAAELDLDRVRQGRGDHPHLRDLAFEQGRRGERAVGGREFDRGQLLKEQSGRFARKHLGAPTRDRTQRDGAGIIAGEEGTACKDQHAGEQTCKLLEPDQEPPSGGRALVSTLQPSRREDRETTLHRSVVTAVTGRHTCAAPWGPSSPCVGCLHASLLGARGPRRDRAPDPGTF